MLVSEEMVLGWVRNRLMVVMDDIAIRGSDVLREVLQTVVNARPDGARLIVTGNLSPRELERVMDSRVVSRICCGAVIEVGGVDRRFEKRGR